MLEQIAEAEGGLRKRSPTTAASCLEEDAKKGLWTLKDAYKRRRAKARIEKTARLRKLDGDARARAAGGRGGDRRAAGHQGAGSSSATGAGDAPKPGSAAAPGDEKKLIARDAKNNPLLSAFAWTPEAVERILRVPPASCATVPRTGSRSWRGARRRADRPRPGRGRDRDRQEDDGRVSGLPDSGQGRGHAAPAPEGHCLVASAALAEATSQNIGSLNAGRKRSRPSAASDLNEVSALAVRRVQNREHASGAGLRQGSAGVGTRLSSHRFCRTDDVALLVDALQRCRAPGTLRTRRR